MAECTQRSRRAEREIRDEAIPAAGVAFGSHQWPTLITPGTGPASLDDLP